MCGNYCNRGEAGGGGGGSDGDVGKEEGGGTACKREMKAGGSYDMHYTSGNMIFCAFCLNCDKPYPHCYSPHRCVTPRVRDQLLRVTVGKRVLVVMEYIKEITFWSNWKSIDSSQLHQETV